MVTKDKEKLYNTRQLVMKTIANASYGVLGLQIFRFFNIDLASSITFSGQEAIKNVIKTSENSSSKFFFLNDFSFLSFCKFIEVKTSLENSPNSSTTFVNLAKTRFSLSEIG